MNKKKKIPTDSPDVGGIPPTFAATTFASTSDKNNMKYNNTNKRKAMIQSRRKAVRTKRGLV